MTSLDENRGSPMTPWKPPQILTSGRVMIADGNGICHRKRGTRAPFFQGHLWSLWWKVVEKTMKKNSQLLCGRKWTVENPQKFWWKLGQSCMDTLILESFGINGNTYVHQQRICHFLQGIWLIGNGNGWNLVPSGKRFQKTMENHHC